MAKLDKPMFFATPKDLRGWLAKRHEQRAELVVGFWKVGSGKASVTWPQAIEEAVAFGWIDGVRHSLDAESYTVRFTPRKPSSAWSRVNIATAKRLVADGRMAPAGLRAFAARMDNKSAIYGYEQREDPKLSEAEGNEL
ncbi:MAG: bacteriocin-protection protein, partial [Thaumarchaeota archaeon]